MILKRKKEKKNAITLQDNYVCMYFWDTPHLEDSFSVCGSQQRKHSTEQLFLIILSSQQWYIQNKVKARFRYSCFWAELNTGRTYLDTGMMHLNTVRHKETLGHREKVKCSIQTILQAQDQTHCYHSATMVYFEINEQK